jgi:hypothetical protein
MAWWSVGIGDDEIGDQPANLVEVTLDEFATAQRASGGQLPTPEVFLAGLAGSLRRHRYNVFGVEALTTDGRSMLYGGQEATEIDTLADDLVSKLMRCYREYHDRDARASEICSVIAFVLRYAPERFFGQAAGWELRRLRPVSNDESRP